MSTSETVNNKMILLYIAGLREGLTQQELMTVALDTLYLDYFSFSKALEQLLIDNLLHKAQRKGEKQTDANGEPVYRFSITTAGRQVLNQLESSVPIPVQRNIHATLNRFTDAARKEQEVTAEYRASTIRGWQVDLAIRDQDLIIFSTGINVPQEEMAQAICATWLQSAGDLYPELLNLFLQK